MREEDHMLNNILINIADSYPQAQATGGTLRMKDAIIDVNRVDDVENDFIIANGIKISSYLKLDKDDEYHLDPKKEGGDFTPFIMEVVNKLLEVTQDNTNDS